jgi:hypothetical protein
MSLGRRGAHATAVALLACVSARAQNANGPEFPVNTYTTGIQFATRVAADGGGRFIVTWSGAGPGDASGIFARRYLSSGTPIGGEFLVNSSVGPVQEYAAVGAAAEAGFVVAWDASGDGDGEGVFARRFDANGAPIGDDFQVNSNTTGDQKYADVGMGPDGSFVVVWNDVQYGTYYTVRARRYDSSGNPVGGDFQVNTFGTQFTYHPRVTALATGGFVVVWDGEGVLDEAGIFGRRYAPNGNAVGAEFRVNGIANLAPWDAYPSIASDASGAFVVSWQSGDFSSGDYDIVARRFDAAGADLGPQFRVNTYTTQQQYASSVGSDGLGNFVVAWHQLGGDGSGFSVQARRYNASGTAVGGDFRVSTYTLLHQYYPSVAVDPRENFFVVWESNGQDGSGSGIFGQRLGDFIFGDGFR